MEEYKVVFEDSEVKESLVFNRFITLGEAKNLTVEYLRLRGSVGTPCMMEELCRDLAKKYSS